MVIKGCNKKAKIHNLTVSKQLQQIVTAIVDVMASPGSAMIFHRAP